MKIDLIKNTISKKNIKNLINWLNTNPKLTKGEQTLKFEKKWSKWLGCKYSIFVNSGSSANLLMIYSLKWKDLKTNEIIVPAVSWATTVSPLLQLGFIPILCDCDKDTLGIRIENLKGIINDPEKKPSALIMTHILGIPSKVKEILKICKENNILVLEDSCESVGSEYNGIKTGNFGEISTFSFYFGHHLSTIEGGMICTNDYEVANLLKMLRSHGWLRDCDKNYSKEMLKNQNISKFKSQYSFFVPGFNLRSSDLNAFLGLDQLKTLDKNNTKRYENFKLYQKLINKNGYSIKESTNFISNFAFPVISKNKNKIINELQKNKIECRPLVCGSLENQPFIKKYNFYVKPYDGLNYAKIIDKYGFYIPNHPKLQKNEIINISEIINKGL